MYKGLRGLGLGVWGFGVKGLRSLGVLGFRLEELRGFRGSGVWVGV